MTFGTLQAFLNQWLELERHSQQGEQFQRDRIGQLAMILMAANSQRDLVEIGCLNGSTTVQLAKAAQDFDRKVVAIDPWQKGTQNCAGGEYEIFLETTAPYANSIEVVRLRSDDPAVRPHIPKAIALAFVDGLHTYESALQDILMVQHAEVIVVDDITWSAEIMDALRVACHETRFTRRLFPLFVGNYREAYLI